jgi:predicted alpha/beta superfamily hydrolase
LHALSVGSVTPSEALLRTTYFTVEAPRLMRAAGYDWDHEIRVALPASYSSTHRDYPVLWITDNKLETALAVLGQTEAILVAVGSPRVTLAENELRRLYDFLPAGGVLFDGPGGDVVRRELSTMDPRMLEPDATGGAPRFLQFLVDDVRPQLEAAYRMDPTNHGLVGFSFGGAFIVFALLTQPDAFSCYICGSPTLWAANGALFDLENTYASAHEDLDATVFLAAGSDEVAEYRIAAHGCVSSMIRMAETLRFRNYPSLRLTTRILPGESHSTMFPPLIAHGVQAVWGRDVTAGITASVEHISSRSR